METRGKPASRRRLEISERDLVVAFKGGDAHAYATIYREFRPVAESICYRILGNPDDAQEAAQETMLRVFQGLPRFNGRYLLRAWVARIATNVCLDMIRRRSRRIDEIETPAAEQLEAQDHLLTRQIADDPGELIERMDEGRRVRQKLQELPEHHRDALLMREFDGLSHEEMAMKLGMTAPQVKALLHRAKKGFRRAWEIETGRASSFVFPALLAAPFRWIRRALSPARDVVTEAAAPVIHLSAQPVVAQASAAIGERAAAAAGAILVAGTIGIGATVLPTRSAPAPAPKQPSVVVADPAEAIDEPAAPGPSGPAVTIVEPSPSPTGVSDEPTPRQQPSETPGEAPVQETPQPQPTHPEEPPASESPSPTPTPAPANRMTMSTIEDLDGTCECDPTGRLTETRTSGTPGQTMSFTQGWSGAIVDAGGDPALQVGVHYDGQVNGKSGRLNVSITVHRGDDIWTYRGNLILSEANQGEGGWRYVFNGTYDFGGGVRQDSPIRTQGKLRTTLLIWEDGTIYSADLKLL